MSFGMVVRGVVGAAAVGFAFAAQGVTVWDEVLDGDLSNDGLAPTSLTFAPGVSSIFGTTGASASGMDRDYFSFTVPTGAELTQVVLRAGSEFAGGSAFIALQVGPQVTVNPVTFEGRDALMGFVHYNNDQIGSDILSYFSLSALPSGTYSVWIQELGNVVPYGLDMVVTTVVPLPAAAWLLAGGLAGFAALRRRKVRVA